MKGTKKKWGEIQVSIVVRTGLMAPARQGGQHRELSLQEQSLLLDILPPPPRTTPPSLSGYRLWKSVTIFLALMSEDVIMVLREVFPLNHVV